MKMKSTLLKMVWPAFLVTAALTVAPPCSANAPAPHRSQQVFEIRFMQDMIDHHAMALMTGMLCEERAVHEELRELCEMMVEMQAKEIEMMQTWLWDWYGIKHEPQMKPGHQRMIQKLAALDGAEFEIEFMRHMVRHHAGAVVAGLNCIDRAYHEPLIELCEEMVEMQLAEIYMLKEWLCEWYGICQGKSHTRMGGVKARP
jgi:uncharacterized protein (DUF305 family)